jgi:YhcN/YlaJ family sporulation lipoprotein
MLKFCGVVLSIILVITSAGCTGMGNNNVKTNEYKARSSKHLITQNHGQVRTYASFNKNFTDKITKDVSSVSGISKATVIVYDRNAIVGINVSKRQNAATVEHKVAQAVKISDPGYDVHVTADPKLYTRIESIRKQLVLHPNTNFSGDIRILIQDIDKVTAPKPAPKPAPRPAPKPAPKPTPKPAPKPTH